MESINKDWLEPAGRKLQAVKQPDGSLQFMFKQIWSDEDIKRSKEENAKAVLTAIGNRLMADESPEAAALLAFLGSVHEASTGTALVEPKDVGKVWAVCLTAINEQPESELAETESELAETFKVL